MATRKKIPFMQPRYPSPALARIVGSKPLTRPKAVQKLWAYIKTHKLQDVRNRRDILADELLLPIFHKERVSMFEMTLLMSEHLSTEPTGMELTYETVNI